MVYHVLNRANGRLRLFKKDEDYLAFERAMVETHERYPLPILAWCLMENHWHFVVQPKEDEGLGRFFGRLGLVHATRWQVAHKAVGIGKRDGPGIGKRDCAKQARERRMRCDRHITETSLQNSAGSNPARQSLAGSRKRVLRRRCKSATTKRRQ
jgi:REP element-mobilizing transposase RayT